MATKGFYNDELKKDSLHALNRGVPAIKLKGTGGFDSGYRLAQFQVTANGWELQDLITFTVPAGVTLNEIEIVDAAFNFEPLGNVTIEEVITNVSIVTVSNLLGRRV